MVVEKQKNLIRNGNSHAACATGWGSSDFCIVDGVLIEINAADGLRRWYVGRASPAVPGRSVA
jgi:hypothetical protein